MRPPAKLVRAVLGALLLVAPITVAVSGAPGADARAIGPRTVRHPAATTAAQQARVRAYWTPERMRTAIPRSEMLPTPRGLRHPQPGTDAVRAPAQPRFGKVFFTENGIRYVCSGTVTTSANRDLVTTAGHCVNAGPGAYVTNFVFVPAYDSGSRPYGTWVARALLTTEAWRTTGDFEHDLGFAVLAEQNGHSIVDITGSYDIAFNLPYGQAFAAYGYPAAPPYDGTTLWRCYGTSGRDLLGGTSDRRLPCTMTGGSSGGGWITGGRLASVTSFGYPGERPPALYGPYLGAVEQATYAAASTS